MPANSRWDLIQGLKGQISEVFPYIFMFLPAYLCFRLNFTFGGLCDELITRPKESYRLCCVVCDLETSRIGAPYIYDISNLRVI